MSVEAIWRRPPASVLLARVLLYGVRSTLLEGDPFGDVVKLFVRREDAERFLADCLADEPEWVTELAIVEIELALSMN